MAARKDSIVLERSLLPSTSTADANETEVVRRPDSFSGGNNDDESDGKGDIEQGNNSEKEVSKELSTGVPGSRFILRLLPMQATVSWLSKSRRVCMFLL